MSDDFPEIRDETGSNADGQVVDSFRIDVSDLVPQTATGDKPAEEAPRRTLGSRPAPEASTEDMAARRQALLAARRETPSTPPPANFMQQVESDDDLLMSAITGEESEQTPPPVRPVARSVPQVRAVPPAPIKTAAQRITEGLAAETHQPAATPPQSSLPEDDGLEGLGESMDDLMAALGEVDAPQTAEAEAEPMAAPALIAGTSGNDAEPADLIGHAGVSLASFDMVAPDAEGPDEEDLPKIDISQRILRGFLVMTTPTNHFGTSLGVTPRKVSWEHLYPEALNKAIFEAQETYGLTLGMAPYLHLFSKMEKAPAFIEDYGVQSHFFDESLVQFHLFGASFGTGQSIWLLIDLRPIQ